MTVYFIGAGPGADDLITIRGARLIEKCGLCLYAGSLVPMGVVASAPKAIDTANLTLGEIIELINDAHLSGIDVARVHSGDPSIYGAIGEQMHYLTKMGIPFEICPGVPSFAASAATIKRELTMAGKAQSIVITRINTRASDMPESENLENFARTGATLAIHLSITNLANVVKQLTPYYGDDCPTAVVYRASWHDEQIIWGTLATIRPLVKSAKLTRTAMILVGRVLDTEDVQFSALYSAEHTHLFRKKAKDEPNSR